MSEIEYKEIAGHLKQGACDPVYLVYGEPFIRDQVIEALVNMLLPDAANRDLYLETVDPADGEGVYDAIERINTLSFLSIRKVVRLKEAGLFSKGFSPEKHIDKIQEAFDQENMRKAANLFLDLLARQQGELDKVISGNVRKALGLEDQENRDLDWLADVARYCRDNQLVPASSTDAAGGLKNAIEKGFPRNHHLIVVTDSADRRTALFKCIKTHGTVINCTVPQGARKADRDEQRRVLNLMMQKKLSRFGKTAEPRVFDQIFELTGFNPRAFAGNIDKLIHYAGAAGRITVEDVAAALDRSREDPVYEFTGAIAAQQAGRALYFLTSLLGGGYHYMQLLSAMTNQVRKLLLVRSFMDGPKGAAWRPGTGFDRFKQQVLPDVIEYDKALLEYIRKSNERITGEESRKAPASDIQIVKNPNNPYPVYQSFLQADRFSGKALTDAVLMLHQADIRLKTTGQTPKAVLEDLIFRICRNPAREK